MIINLIKYYWYSIKARSLLGFSAAEFVNQGIGIQVRSNRFKQHWSKHFRNSKKFILDCFEQPMQIKTVLVLGAGALNDLPVKELLDSGIKLFFVDLDLATEKIWLKWKNKYPNQIGFAVCDVTGRLADWTKLARNCKITELENQLLKQNPKISRLLDNKFDLVISLNILSQLGVIWKERLHKVVPKDKHDTIDDLKETTTRLLEHEHLDLISKISNIGFILISDKYFHCYKPHLSNWQTEFATSTDYEQYLIADKSISLKNQDRWLWHLRPANTEGLDYGEIHHVRAYFFIKNQNILKN